MDTLKVYVDNWPAKDNFLSIITICIALLALGVSLYSVYLTRKSFIISHRPYVWAVNCRSYGPDMKTLIPVPSMVLFSVKNSPAKIITLQVRVSLNKVLLESDMQHNLFRFPDDTLEWAFAFSKEDYKNIMDKSKNNMAALTREIDIDYTSLDAGKIYHYRLQQSFNTIENQWKDISATAD